ncbi:hypothetical protein SAMN05216573_113122 [Bradyrhizobium sp. Rc3b]|uniref:hypothetical protein n=1 Tax=unclassified Bradyrhizobium TaxID=2631580 RepID=UPI0008EB5B9B|nr:MULTISPECIES: hypothetical protein [unclassified Bradyrhizobium]MBB4376162.1 ATP-dependent DNA ligase [Bradyrhizobium sp. SBR1B]SFN45151.1 hypothetical protein SAMN05216573_113122 [Bradyrhizobium sp. Rc3b]
MRELGEALDHLHGQEIPEEPTQHQRTPPRRYRTISRSAHAFEFCLPKAAKAVPIGHDWLHEIRCDGYHLHVGRKGEAVRLITKNGHEATLKNREQQFIIDGEAVVLGVDGASDFNALHSSQHDDEVQLYAFHILALDGEDLRRFP